MQPRLFIAAQWPVLAFLKLVDISGRVYTYESSKSEYLDEMNRLIWWSTAVNFLGGRSLLRCPIDKIGIMWKVDNGARRHLCSYRRPQVKLINQH